MAIIGRWTTPILCFNLPFDVENIDILSIAFKQNDCQGNDQGLLFEKKIGDCTLSGKQIICALSTNDTRTISATKGNILIQIRIKIGNNELSSKFIEVYPYDVLKDGEIDS